MNPAIVSPDSPAEWQAPRRGWPRWRTVIRPEERRPLRWLGLLALFLGIFAAAYFTGGTAVFLASVEPKTLAWLLPLLYMASGLAAFAVRWAFSALLGRWAFTTLALGTLGLVLSLDLLFVWAFASGTYEEFPLLVGSALFVSLAPVLAVLDLLYWTAAERLFGPPQLQRLYRALSRRVLLATLAGFFLVYILVYQAWLRTSLKDTSFGTLFMTDLFGVAAGAVILSAFSVWILARLPGKGFSSSAHRVVLAPPGAGAYLPILVALVLVAVLTHYLVDLGFLTILRTWAGIDMVALAGSLGTLFFLFKLAELVFRALLASWLSRRFGPTVGVQTLPLALGACLGLFLFLGPTGSWDSFDWVLLVFLLKGLEVLLRGPLVEPSFGVFIQPLPASLETAVRGQLARIVHPLGAIVAGALLLLLGLLPQWGPELWSWTLAAVLALFLVLSFIARRLYRRRIQSALESAGPEPVATQEGDAALAAAEQRVALVKKVLPLFMAEFPGEHRGATEAERGDAFRILEGLPDLPALRPIRAAAARRSCGELRGIASQYLLDVALQAPAGVTAPTAFAFAGPLPGEDTGYGPASLGLLQRFELLIPEAPSREGTVGPAVGVEQDAGAVATPEFAAGVTAAGQPGPAHDRSNPFPGLRPFEPEEARLFFGRGVHTRELVRKLGRNRFLAVVGASGSGKSSLVRAGLIPALGEGLLPGTGPHWRVAIFRPGGDPVGELARALVAPGVLDETQGPPREEDRLLRATLTEVTLRRSAFGLAEAVRQARLPGGTHLLVVVDQFEEVFRFKREAEGQRGGEEAAAFVALLLEASRASDLQLYVVLTMRSDYLGDCVQFRDLPETINDAQYLIPRLTREQRRETIVSPVRVAGAAITPRLVERLLNDVGDDPDQLPILQHALMRTWDRWAADGAAAEPLDTPHYEAAGRMASALSTHADEVFTELGNDRLKVVAERLFKALADPGEDGRGVRRGVRLDELATAVETTPEELRVVIDAFRQPGRSFLMPPVGALLAPDQVIDISHESLMRIWDRLRRWVAEEAESAKTYRRLVETALLQREGKARLWSDPDLTQALRWRETERPNACWARRYHPAFATGMDFLDASDQAARREQRRARIRILGGLGFIGGIAILMFLLWARAQHNLNQLRALIDADRLDRLVVSRCPLLFALERVTDADLDNPGVASCVEARKQALDLLAKLDGHRKTLSKLEKMGTPEDQSQTVLYKAVQFFKAEFQGASQDFQHQMDTVRRLVSDLESMKGKPILRSDLEALLHQMVRDFKDERWKKAAGAVAASPHYGGLVLKPQVGLLPLGPDPESGLWEFAHILSGEVPVRGEDGRLAIDGETGVVLVLIPGGSFLMGSEKNPNEGPVRLVTVPPFLIAKHELTQGQLERLTGENPSLFFRDDNRRLPALNHSFDAALAIAAAERLYLLVLIEIVESTDAVLATAATAGGLRLPTEAEWEYAARAGTTTDYWWGNEPKAGGKVWANCSGCGSQWDGKRPAPVGSFPANPFGLHDTAGNVWEWVQDAWHVNYQGAPVDGSAWEESIADGPGVMPPDGKSWFFGSVKSAARTRVVRGGSWDDEPLWLRSAARTWVNSRDRGSSIGFRLARTLNP